MEIKPLTLKSIRECGKDEYWLQDYICETPSALGLGDLEVVAKEKSQKGGGRLDILLRNEDEDFFEVEVMLGETDESHIIRTIEYWDLEKRRWPKRQHTAVLVAEGITTRFYNIIHLLSLNVPIIGIQANIYELGEEHGLVFNKVIDSYEEPEFETDIGNGYYTSESLANSYPETNKVVGRLKQMLAAKQREHEVVYKKYGASFYMGGDRRINVHKRGAGQSSVEYAVSPEDSDSAAKLLETAGIKFDKKYDRIRIWTDDAGIVKNADSHNELITYLK